MNEVNKFSLNLRFRIGKRQSVFIYFNLVTQKLDLLGSVFRLLKQLNQDKEKRIWKRKTNIWKRKTNMEKKNDYGKRINSNSMTATRDFSVY